MNSLDQYRKILEDGGRNQLPVAEAMDILERSSSEAESTAKTRGTKRTTMVSGGLIGIILAILASWQTYNSSLSQDIEKRVRAEIAAESESKRLTNTADALNAFKSDATAQHDALARDIKRVGDSVAEISSMLKRPHMNDPRDRHVRKR